MTRPERQSSQDPPPADAPSETEGQPICTILERGWNLPSGNSPVDNPPCMGARWRGSETLRS